VSVLLLHKGKQKPQFKARKPQGSMTEGEEETSVCGCWQDKGF